MHSAIYHGWLRHRRFSPRPHAFRYRLCLMYLDLAEIDTVFADHWLWSTRRTGLARLAWARFDRADHLGDPSVPLDESVRRLVQQETGKRPTGPIRLLTHLRYFGYCFNPVSFYYCFDSDDTRVEATVAEVTNTPWRERHCYVLSERETPSSASYSRYHTEKEMHVSPFMPMDVAYRWGFSAPGPTLNVHMSLHRGQKLFDATMCLERAPITGIVLARALVTYPLMTMRVTAAIHWEALRLWLKGVPVQPHPRQRSASTQPACSAPLRPLRTPARRSERSTSTQPPCSAPPTSDRHPAQTS